MTDIKIPSIYYHIPPTLCNPYCNKINDITYKNNANKFTDEFTRIISTDHIITVV